MKQFLFTLVLVGFVSSSFAQLNMSLRSQVNYTISDLNDVWGWKDEETGIEYALVGLRAGVSIVSLEDPDNAVEVQFIPGASSLWRDLKTWEDHLYVSNETGEGLMVIDLSPLPEDSVTFYNWEPNIPEIGGTLAQIHNLYVDEGVLYLSGSNLNNGGNLIVDVATDPANPVYVAAAPPVYAHDVFVRDNIMYSSEIYAGAMTIYDISDVNNIQQLATQITPFQFTHNIWLSDDSSVAFTTDERGDAPVTAYDISDLDNIIELDQYKPIETLGEGVLPHNVHVWEDWLVISYYTDGGIIVDASRPENLIEVGNFDTFLTGTPGFGAWGLYPFLPSGLVLVTDNGNGLSVLDANYVRACWLEGTVTDANTGEVLGDVSVSIDSEQANMGVTEADGFYETGQAIPGDFEVTYEKTGYFPKTITTTLENGVVTMEDVELEPLESFTIAGTVVSATDDMPIENATIVIMGETISYSVNSDATGTFTINVLGGDYEIFAGAWGYLQTFITGQSVSMDNPPITIQLVEGYEDDFVLDLGWMSSADETTTSGFWERGEPNGTATNGNPSNPDFDLNNDLGDQAYVTGNAGGGVGDDDIDGGNVLLTSPIMDLSDYEDATVHYSLWFFNAGGNGTPNDQLQVRISNGTEEVVLETVTTSSSQWRPESSFTLADKLALTSTMTISFESGDQPQPNGHLVEAAVDGFSVVETPVSVETVASEDLAITAFPNPFSDKMTLSFDLSSFENDTQLNVYNALGQLVQQLAIDRLQTSVELGSTLDKGVYFVELLSDDKVSQSLRIVKQ